MHGAFVGATTPDGGVKTVGPQHNSRGRQRSYGGRRDDFLGRQDAFRGQLCSRGEWGKMPRRVRCPTPSPGETGGHTWMHVFFM